MNTSRRKINLEKEVIPATSDHVFKALMAKCPRYRTELTSMITGIPRDVILNTYYEKNTEHVVDTALEKGRTSDYIFGLDNYIVNYELNDSLKEGLIDRNDNYFDKIKISILKMSESYQSMPVFIQINLNNFNKFNKFRDIAVFKSRDEDGVIETLKWEKYHLSYKKALRKYLNGKRLSKLEKYLVILPLRNKKDLDKVSEGDDILMEAVTEIKRMTYDLDKVGLYDIEEDRKRLEKTGLIAAEQKGERRGEKKGLKMGLEQGIERGKLETAKNLIAMNLPLKDVVKATGLSEKQVRKLC